MKTKGCRKLDPPELARLKQYIGEHGGQVKASILLGGAPWTLSRTANQRTGPSRMLTEKLVSIGVIEA